MSPYARIPFWLHALIECPAGINFLLRPSEQLSSPASQAEAIIRQYGILLLVSALICLILATRDLDNKSRKTIAWEIADYSKP